MKPGCLTIAEASREFIATVVTSWVIVPFFFRSQWSSGVRSPVFFPPHRVATSRSYACTSASQFWQEIHAEIRIFYRVGVGIAFAGSVAAIFCTGKLSSFVLANFICLSPNRGSL